MSDKIFWDTIVAVYYATNNNSRLHILQLALQSDTEIVISSQVLNEFSNVAYKKLGYDSMQVTTHIKAFIKAFTVVPLIPAYTLKAIEVKNRYGFSYYDSLIIATALENGCKWLYSEDMHHGQTIDKLTISNPFVGN